MNNILVLVMGNFGKVKELVSMFSLFNINVVL